MFTGRQIADFIRSFEESGNSRATLEVLMRFGQFAEDLALSPAEAADIADALETRASRHIGGMLDEQGGKLAALQALLARLRAQSVSIAAE